ncbi:MAG: alkaline phosphatase family protein [Flavobacteriales bacterium]
MHRIFFLLCLIPGNFVAQKPKLVVGIVVDQMCYEYLFRFQHHFGEGGFKKLLQHGISCANTLYNYVPTVTGPGHASIYTGTTPANHGIINNEWYDRMSKNMVNCVSDSSVHAIGVPSEKGKASPQRLETNTVTDQLKLTYPNSKVFSISIKDRGAILPGGHLSDGTFWLDAPSGTFITSSYYASALPDWLAAFNASHQAQHYFSPWDLLHPRSNYVNTLDDSPYEKRINNKPNPTFPYTFTKENWLSYFTLTPSANTMLTDLALAILKNEKLGDDQETDMLCISYSTPDIVGHTFGPYSMEIEDLYARLDLELKRLFNYLNKTIGDQEILIFLTADHAVVPVPQQLIDLRLPGGYFDLSGMLEQLKKEQQKMFGVSLLSNHSDMNLYWDRSVMDSLHLTINAVNEHATTFLYGFPEIKAVCGRESLLANHQNDPWKAMIQRGFQPHRSGDLLFILKPGYLGIEDGDPFAHQGTTHGSCYNYDTHVPLLWYGYGLKPKTLYRTIDIPDIAATLVHFLSLQRTGGMTGKPIPEVLRR